MARPGFAGKSIIANATLSGKSGIGKGYAVCLENSRFFHHVNKRNLVGDSFEKCILTTSEICASSRSSMSSPVFTSLLSILTFFTGGLKNASSVLFLGVLAILESCRSNVNCDLRNETSYTSPSSFNRTAHDINIPGTNEALAGSCLAIYKAVSKFRGCQHDISLLCTSYKHIEHESIAWR